MSIPITDPDLTAEWLSGALDATVTKVTATPLGVGVGLVGQLYRLDLVADDAPRTVIAKLAAAKAEDRFVAMVLNMYGREHGFYTELSRHTPIAHPECYYADYDPETHDAVLLLEDVSGRGRALDQVAGCSMDDARPAIRTLTKLHAHFWDDAMLTEIPWLLRLCDDPYPGAVGFAYETAWPNVQEFFPDIVDDRVRAFGDAYAERIPALFSKLSEGPLVFSHSDWRADNLFVASDDEVIAVDWQLIDRSVGLRDLAYLMTQSVTTTNPSDYTAAFDMYLAEMKSRGVAVERGWAWDLYRYAASFGFVYPVVAAGALTVADPRHLDVTRSMMQRCLTAIAALDAFDLPL